MRPVVVVIALLTVFSIASGAARAQAQTRAAMGPLHAVSLGDLERQARDAISQGRKLALDEREIGLSDITGYKRTGRDIELVGPPGNDIRLGHFVGALRLASHDAVGVTLIPEDLTDPASRHRVEFFPRELRYAWRLAEPLIAADVDVKRRAIPTLVKRHRDELKTCGASAAPETIIARILFLPAEPELAKEDTETGFNIWIRRADVVLKPEPDVVIAGDPSASDRPVDANLAAFADEFSASFAALERVAPIYRRLHTMYRLVLAATLLRLEEVPWSSAFWLEEYPLSSVALPELISGLDESVARTCWGNAKYEYTGTSIRRRIWGGVVIAYRTYLESHAVGRVRAVGSSGAATVSTGTTASTATAPAASARAGGWPATAPTIGRPAQTLPVPVGGVAGTSSRVTLPLPSTSARVLLPPVSAASNTSNMRLAMQVNRPVSPLGALGNTLLVPSVSTIPWGSALSSNMLMLRPLTPFTFSTAPSSPWSYWRTPGSPFPTWNLRLPSPQLPRLPPRVPLPPPRIPVCTTGRLGAIVCR